jgi:hypothetical protein
VNIGANPLQRGPDFFGGGAFLLNFPPAAQQSRDFRLMVHFRDFQRRFFIVVPPVDIGAFFEQHLDHIFMAICRCAHQRSHAKCTQTINVGALFQQQGRDILVPSPRRACQSQITGSILSADDLRPIFFQIFFYEGNIPCISGRDKIIHLFRRRALSIE